ncbi:gliding motility protein GldN [Pedobacter sp. ASV28]|uniref:type IX secretion system ring protein PorN/GldN n=1 Tax=Pedobacter sp. ASV28 TaxID=2795123 RepID=UPI0018ECF59C|nr:gliding motility protein GldN [Pedobacter sp. ASV28]
MKKIFLFVVLVSLSTVLFAQNKKGTGKNTPAKKPTVTKAKTETPPPVTPVKEEVKPKKPRKPKQDGYVFAKDTIVAEPIPYPEIKKEDIVYTKRVWRIIDFRDKGNQVLTSPKVNLIGVIYDAISKGELELFGIDDESFERDPVSAEKPKNSKKSLADTSFLGINPNTNELNGANNDFFAQAFKGLRLKEDWIFDVKRGVFEPRIVGIAPIRLDSRAALNADGTPVVGADGQPMAPTVTEQPVGWIYFDDLRTLLANTKIANDGNDNSGLTFDDIFLRRLFFSHITKTSNSADLRIEDLMENGKALTPKERLLEAERIKKKMADFEQGLWEY